MEINIPPIRWPPWLKRVGTPCPSNVPKSPMSKKGNRILALDFLKPVIQDLNYWTRAAGLLWKQFSIAHSKGAPIALPEWFWRVHRKSSCSLHSTPEPTAGCNDSHWLKWSWCPQPSPSHPAIQEESCQLSTERSSHLGQSSDHDPLQMPLPIWDYLRLLRSCLIHFAEQVLQLWPMSHQLMIYSISFVQKCIDVGNSLDRKRHRWAHEGFSSQWLSLRDLFTETFPIGQVLCSIHSFSSSE